MHTNSLPVSDRDETPAPDTRSKPDTKYFPANAHIRDTLRQLRTKSNIYSNAQLGAKLGYSATVMSLYLSEGGNKYNGNVAGLESKAEDFLRAMERRRTSGVSTSPSKISDDMFTAFEYIRKCGDFGVIIADSGEGKSRGIEMILEKNTLSILIEVTEWACDKHALMSAMWVACGLDGWDRTQPRFAYLIQRMRGSDRPFIIDDAHKLSHPALSLLATFQEKTACPVALVGIPDLVKKLESDPQRFSRAGIKYAIEPGSEDPDLLIHMVRSIAKSVGSDLDELLDLCSQVARHQGCKRAVEKQLKLALELRHTDSSLNWPQAFRQAHTMLFRPYKLA